LNDRSHHDRIFRTLARYRDNQISEVYTFLVLAPFLPLIGLITHARVRWREIRRAFRSGTTTPVRLATAPRPNGAIAETRRTTPQDVVLSLVRVISGDDPLRAATVLLDPDVVIHMDAIDYRGWDIWFKWIYLIRNCGRIANLRMTPMDIRDDGGNPELVRLAVRWSGVDRRRGQTVQARADDVGLLQYRVKGGRIVEIWTRRTNYRLIFGPWIQNIACYRAFIAWAFLHFATMRLRGVSFGPLEQGLASSQERPQ
jgi:hypothetical protein